ncbi:golvesin C-terminal-like domain-containing protein [Aeoliella sp. SH292]|uniref:golvesin C-terminal-like domain-containing protein n=1 Tax=Aeoliella sp. SH292 TaxID=3454464 RepID=UPI003F986EF6
MLFQRAFQNVTANLWDRHKLRKPLAARSKPGRSLALEPLESRFALSSMGLVETPYAPTGGLDGKIVYVHGGHGYYADNLGDGDWFFQRPETFEMIEDLGNQDQMSYLVDYLFRAGATVVPLRPVGHQPNEVVLDNDDLGVSFRGAWSNSNASVYYGSVGDVSYRFATSSLTETAVARYQPNIPEAGYYPIYTFVTASANRAADQLYRVHHAGGETEVTVNHRRVGNGLVYLGTYYFEAGTEGYVEISNKSSQAGSAVIADMIRFGNGMGDMDRGGGVSGRTREDEMALYWTQWHATRSQGIPSNSYRISTDDFESRVSAAPLYAAYMNREADGDLSDRLFVSFHSNASGGSGTARGVEGLWNDGSGSNTATPNQFLLADLLAREINTDLIALNGTFEHNWASRANPTYGASFGEINNNRIGGEFDATIIETGYHDNQQDAEMLRDPRVRDALARSTYQGIVKYFRAVDGNTTPLSFAPSQVAGVWAASSTAGSVTLHWQPPVASGALGDSATGYRLFVSTNGYAFDGGTYVAGASATSHTFSGLDPLQTYYFQVVAENAGGASPGSQVVAAKPNDSEYRVLIVNAFDRLGRSQNPREAFGAAGNTIDRVRTQQSNSGDYAVVVAQAIQRQAKNLGIATASNERVADGSVNLADYDAVIWMAGEESTADQTFSPAEQTLVAQYIAAGGNVFASGSEIGWDLDAQNNGRSFFENVLRANYVADNANSYTATGTNFLAGLDLSFDNGQKFYDVNFPDVLGSSAGSAIIATYPDGRGAATYAAGTGGAGDVVVMGVPVESILSTAAQDEAIRRILVAFGLPTVVDVPTELTIDNGTGSPAFTTTGSWTSVTSSQAQGGSYLRASAGTSATATWQFELDQYGEVELFVRWLSTSSTASAARFTIDTGFGLEEVYANQATQGGEWVSLGRFAIAAGTRAVTLYATGATGGAHVIADAVRLTVSDSQSVFADSNQDNQVNLADYSVWRDQLGASTVRGSKADADGDGLVTAADYRWWKLQYGTTRPVQFANETSRSAFSAAAGDLSTTIQAAQENASAANEVLAEPTFASTPSAIKLPSDSAEKPHPRTSTGPQATRQVDDALLLLFRAPNSLTRADAVREDALNAVGRSGEFVSSHELSIVDEVFESLVRNSEN